MFVEQLIFFLLEVKSRFEFLLLFVSNYILDNLVYECMFFSFMLFIELVDLYQYFICLNKFKNT